MVRYKRNRRYRRNSTNVIKMKFQSFMDIHTTANQLQIISISAGGDNILKRLPFQFAGYKYYKIGNISVKLVPASTLPVDPTGLSIQAGASTVDPRDQLTPGMMRITNGEDVFEDISGMSATDQHTLYNSMMLDPRWYKWMLQSGVKRHAKPRYWTVGQLHQDKWPGATVNVPNYDGSPSKIVDTTSNVLKRSGSPNGATGTSAIQADYVMGASSPYGLFQTGHKGVLGWLPTDGMQFGQPFITAPPTIECFKIILPPAYKTEYWYRCYISETVYFRDPVMNMPSQFNSLDVFHQMSSGDVLVPTLPSVGSASSVTDDDTGGNYGGN